MRLLGKERMMEYKAFRVTYWLKLKDGVWSKKSETFDLPGLAFGFAKEVVSSDYMRLESVEADY